MRVRLGTTNLSSKELLIVKKKQQQPPYRSEIFENYNVVNLLKKKRQRHSVDGLRKCHHDQGRLGAGNKMLP